MPDRKGATLLEDLPDEIIDKILIRLPSKDVGRCRAVSTSWRTATSTHRFMLEHHRRQPSFPIINGDGRPASLMVFRDAGAGASNLQLWPFPPSFFKHSSDDRLRGACDGFIIVSRRSLLFLFYIYNPVIRKKAVLPQPQVGKGFCNNIIGFYRYHPTGEYRVLWVSQSGYLSEYSLYVLTVGANEPRNVKVRMPIVSSPSVEQKLLKELSCYPPPVHHCSSLHWCPYIPCSVSHITVGPTTCGTHLSATESQRTSGWVTSEDPTTITGRGGNIIVFDTKAESFRWMHSPTQPCTRNKLFNMKGMLAFWGCSPAVMNVWVMPDYEAEIWAFKYRIELSTVEVSRQLYSTSLKKKKKGTPLDSTVQCFSDMVVLNERELLIKFNKKYVLRCDIDGKFLGMVNIGKSQYCMLLTQHRLRESIIPFPSHEMQGEDEEPPFFIEHV